VGSPLFHISSSQRYASALLSLAHTATRHWHWVGMRLHRPATLVQAYSFGHEGRTNTRARGPRGHEPHTPGLPREGARAAELSTPYFLSSCREPLAWRARQGRREVGVDGQPAVFELFQE
jgi:hypothetical protein